jgi:hypothetical protein
MNRLAPLIVRRPRTLAFAAAAPAPRRAFAAAPELPPPSDELRLFATSFVGGLVFFSTFLA